MASVWGELKRRNVVKVAVAYAIVGWLFCAYPVLGEELRYSGSFSRLYAEINQKYGSLKGNVIACVQSNTIGRE